MSTSGGASVAPSARLLFPRSDRAGFVLVFQVAVFFAIASLPVVSVAALLAVMRRCRRLLALGGVCASIFGLLFLLVGFLVANREPAPGNSEPPTPLAGALLYAAVVGIIASDFAAILGIPLLFRGRGRGPA